MGFVYTVKQGDCLSSIAARNGFNDWRTVYNDPNNAGFRAQRPDPNLIYPGDEGYVSDKQCRQEACAVDQRHRFKLHRWPTRLKVFLKDGEDRPYANMKYVLTVDGVDHSDTTNGEGLVDRAIDPAAEMAELRVFPEGEDGPPAIWTLALGHLDPVKKISGIQARLNNLGFDAGPVDGIEGPLTRGGVKAFQTRYGLQVDGIAGPITQAKLKEVYGC